MSNLLQDIYYLYVNYAFAWNLYSHYSVRKLFNKNSLMFNFYNQAVNLVFNSWNIVFDREPITAVSPSIFIGQVKARQSKATHGMSLIKLKLMLGPN